VPFSAVVKGELKALVRQKSGRGTGLDGSVGYKQYPVTVMEGKVKVMGRDGDAFNDSPTDKVTQQEEQPTLVGRVQMDGRFVQHEYPRFLCQRPSDHDALPFAVAQFADGAVGQGGDTALLQGELYGITVLPVRTVVGKATQCDQLPDAEIRRRYVVGEHHCDGTGSSTPVQGSPSVEGMVFQKYDAGPGRQQA
jgi:hypothetical protein